MELQLGQLRLNPPDLAQSVVSKWGKWVDRLSDFGKYKGYIRGSTSADLAVCIYYVNNEVDMPTSENR